MIKEKTKSYLRKEFVFSVLSIEKENQNQDRSDFNRPRNLVIVYASLQGLNQSQPFLPPIKENYFEPHDYLGFSQVKS